MTIQRIRMACLMPKATNAHSEYVILITFPLPQTVARTRPNVTLYVHCLACCIYRCVTFRAKYFSKKYFSVRRCIHSRRRINKCHDKANRAVNVPGMRARIRSVSRWMGHMMGEKVLSFWEHLWSSEPSKYRGAKGQRNEMKTWACWLNTHWFYGAFLFEKLTGSQLIEIFPTFYGIRRFVTATCPYPEQDRFVPCPHIPLPEDPS